MSNELSETTSLLPAPARLQRNLFWRFSHIVLSPFFMFWARVSSMGTENIDDSRGGLLLLNHQSYLDPLLAAYPLRRPISYMAREELFRVPVLSWILRRTYTQAISQTAFRGSSIRRAVDRMNDGFLVGIFPEGERTVGDVKQFNRGFLSLVRRVDVPVYPVAIVGADRVMPPGSALIRPGRITIVYGNPLTAEELERLRNSGDDREMAEMMRQRVADCMAQAG